MLVINKKIVKITLFIFGGMFGIVTTLYYANKGYVKPAGHAKLTFGIVLIAIGIIYKTIEIIHNRLTKGIKK